MARQARSATCAVCGEPFEALDPRARLCSDRCRKRKQRGAALSESAEAEHPAPGPVEEKVRADIGALMTSHPMGEALAEASYAMARLVDRYPAAAVAANRELRTNLLELAGMGVGDDSDADLDGLLSTPVVPTEVRDTPES